MIINGMKVAEEPDGVCNGQQLIDALDVSEASNELIETIQKLKQARLEGCNKDVQQALKRYGCRISVGITIMDTGRVVPVIEIHLQD